MFLSFDLTLEMAGPGKLHEQPHQERGGNGEASLVEEADGDEAKHHRMCCAPEPKILVQEIEHQESKNKEDSFHDRLSSRDRRLRCLQRKRTLVLGLWSLFVL